jgi:hypothetical protein
VRVRDHVLVSTVGAVLLYPRLRGTVLGPWAASILIDVDHYLWFCLRQRRLHPLAALRFFTQAQPPQHRQTRLLHSPGLLLGLLLLGHLPSAPTRRRMTTWALLGMAFHVGLDAYDRARRDQARRAALARDGFTCQRCGAQGPGVVAHLGHQPCLLPSYRPAHFTSLCGACHEAAHAARSAAAAPAAAPWVPQRPKAAHGGARRRLCAAAPGPVALGARSHG